MKLYNDDSLNIMKTMKDNSIDLIVTDPPYEISTTGGGGTINSVKKFDTSLQSLDELNISDGYDIEIFGEEIIRILKNPNIYIWCNKVQIPRYLDFYVNKYKCKFEIITWHKTNALPTYSNKYLTDTEYCLYFHKDVNVHPNSYEDAKTFYNAPLNQKDKKLYQHPTIKPVEILERFIRNSSNENDIVFDAFMGSGSTGVACLLNNRDFIGCEINKDYYDMSCKRIEQIQKKQYNNLPIQLKTKDNTLF